MKETCHLYITNPTSSDSNSLRKNVSIPSITKTSIAILNNPSGSPLIVVVVILAVIAIAATFASRNSTEDVIIAGIDSLHKLTLNEADGATEMAAELLEQNLSCPNGFTTSLRGPSDELDPDDRYIDIWVDNLNFWQNNLSDAVTPDIDNDIYDFYYPSTYNPESDDFEPHTTVTMGGQTRFALGGAIQMAAGYEGKGKGASGGGALMKFDIMIVRKSYKNSEAMCRMEWMHVIGQEGKCTP